MRAASHCRGRGQERQNRRHFGSNSFHQGRQLTQRSFLWTPVPHMPPGQQGRGRSRLRQKTTPRAGASAPRPRRRRRLRATASARAKAAAKALAEKNTRRDARRAACRSLNELARKLHVSASNLVDAKPGNPMSLHQTSWDTMRIWWFPLLCRGKLHVDCFDSSFPGETPQGAVYLVDKVRSAVNVRFQNAASKPDTLYTDRGRGFYMTNSGDITAEYKGALAQNGFKATMGDNAVMQPGSLQDALLHETAVSWLRLRLSRSTPAKCWQESREA